MTKHIVTFAMLLTFIFSLLMLGASLVGQALPYRGEIRYFLQNINGTTPYAMDALRGLAYAMRSIFPTTWAEWSPDNQYIIVWMSGTYLTKTTPSPLHLLSNQSVSPQWSADGTYLSFFTFENSYGRVYLGNGDGTEVALIMPDDLVDYSDASFSPDSTRLVYIRAGDLYSMNLADQQVTRLTHTVEAFESTARWSPDGEHIAFLWVDAQQIQHLGIIDTDGQNRREFVNESVENVGTPHWSPDSARLSFFSNTLTGTQFFVANISTGEVNLVGSNDVVNMTANEGWSTDGMHIIALWLESDMNGNATLVRMQVNVETGAVIEEALSGQPFSVATSSDETEFAYVTDWHGICIDNEVGETLRCFPVGNGTPLLNTRWLP